MRWAAVGRGGHQLNLVIARLFAALHTEPLPVRNLTGSFPALLPRSSRVLLQLLWKLELPSVVEEPGPPARPGVTDRDEAHVCCRKAGADKVVKTPDEAIVNGAARRPPPGHASKG